MIGSRTLIILVMYKVLHIGYALHVQALRIPQSNSSCAAANRWKAGADPGFLEGGKRGWIREGA